MQSSNLYFVYNSESQSFWNKKNNQIAADLIQSLMQDQGEVIIAYKIGKLLKKIVARRYKTYQQHLFYFLENGEIGGYAQLSNVYCRVSLRVPTQTVPFDRCLQLTKNHSTIELYCHWEDSIKGFLQELQSFCIMDNFEQHFQLQHSIGNGSTAQVFLALNHQNQQQYAVKQIIKESLSNRYRQLKSRTLLEEITIMRSLDHPNIMKLHQVYESEAHVMLVMNLFEGGQLMDKVKNFDFLTKRELCRELFETVNYMHSKGIMHRDLKPLNILYKDKDPRSREFGIGDFGFSTSIKYQKHVLQKCGTPGYVAPEIIEFREGNKMYGLCCDVFSLGVIMYEIFFNSHPFKSNNKDNTLRQIVNAQIQFDERLNLPQSLKSLIICMTRKNPRHRFTLQQCLEQDFFKEKLSRFNESSQEAEEQDILYKRNEPQPMQVRTIRCQTFQHLKQQNIRRQSLPQDIQEPQIQQRKSIHIKHRQSIASTNESKLKQESQYQKSIMFDKMISDVFINDSHHLPKVFGNTYLIKKF